MLSGKTKQRIIFHDKKENVIVILTCQWKNMAPWDQELHEGCGIS